MNFFWWVFGSLFIFLAVYYAFVSCGEIRGDYYKDYH